ncbi:hypothetical protein TorRG33x02_150380 [Trema orientale]|uniref:Uncharacterized protein n=1 Tax=Trema orientale TaxID=63057 RepID=A0A2P5EUH8_TREOI|nr:hypothetical protein TorRG33x02_150380 [Trema orientale]
MSKVALAEWLRRVPAKYMGFPRESSNLLGDEVFCFKWCSSRGLDPWATSNLDWHGNRLRLE